MFEFDKKQRLCSKKRIETLFKQGKSFLVYPLSIRYVLRKGCGDVSVLIVCPKRYQKHAVDRNRVKRLIRENYRQSSLDLKRFAKENNVDMDFSMLYVSKHLISFEDLHTAIKDVLSHLQEEITKNISVESEQK